jgi:hypothetical protein
MAFVGIVCETRNATSRETLERTVTVCARYVELSFDVHLRIERTGHPAPAARSWRRKIAAIAAEREVSTSVAPSAPVVGAQPSAGSGKKSEDVVETMANVSADIHQSIRPGAGMA